MGHLVCVAVTATSGRVALPRLDLPGRDHVRRAGHRQPLPVRCRRRRRPDPVDHGPDPSPPGRPEALEARLLGHRLFSGRTPRSGWPADEVRPSRVGPGRRRARRPSIAGTRRRPSSPARERTPTSGPATPAKGPRGATTWAPRRSWTARDRGTTGRPGRSSLRAPTVGAGTDVGAGTTRGKEKAWTARSWRPSLRERTATDRPDHPQSPREGQRQNSALVWDVENSRRTPRPDYAIKVVIMKANPGEGSAGHDIGGGGGPNFPESKEGGRGGHPWNGQAERSAGGSPPLGFQKLDHLGGGRRLRRGRYRLRPAERHRRRPPRTPDFQTMPLPRVSAFPAARPWWKPVGDDVFDHADE